MSTDTNFTKKRVRRQHSAKTGNPEQRANIFELIDPLPKAVGDFLPYSKYEDNIQYCANIIAYLKQIEPEKYAGLKFNTEHDDIYSLIYKLNYAVVGHGQDGMDFFPHIIYNNHNEPDRIFVTYKLPMNYDWKWWNVDVNDMYRIKNEKLRIGYAHMLKKISGISHNSVLDWPYFDQDDNMFQMIFEWWEQGAEESGDEEDGDNVLLLEVKDQIEEELVLLREHKIKFDRYVQKDIQLFYKCKPRDPWEKKFKKFLVKAFKLDFGQFMGFAPSESMDNVQTHYEDSVLVYFDSDSRVESEHMQFVMEAADNEGAAYPMGFYHIEKGEVVNRTPPEKIKGMFDFCNFISKLYSEHLNKL